MIIADFSTKEVINSQLMDFDYFIIGQGIAGTVLAHSLEKQGFSYCIIDADHPETSSKVAAGLFNPVTGKRVVKTWKADYIFPYAATFYTALEEQLSSSFYHPKEIYKPYQSIEEQNDVIAKTAEERLAPFISLKADNKFFHSIIENPLGGISINQGGYLNTQTFLTASRKHFDSKGAYFLEEIDNKDFTFKNDSVQWKGLHAKKIIFCEGYRAKFNPLFSWLPFSVTKGEMLQIEMENFPESHIINKGGFILPKGNNSFICGSSYEHSIENTVTEKGRLIVEDKLNSILKVPYKITGQRAAIRPTVRDRRPYIGLHPENNKIAIFNGMGTKGVTLSPYFADEFVSFLEKNGELNKEVNISRYFSLYFESEQK